MCGICGVFTFNGINFEITQDLVVDMRDTMIHRGPDDSGIYISPDRRIGLGHRRLSIIDLSSAGRQPMCTEDGAVLITYNGEVYNHQRLRNDLEKNGHLYKSLTDTETILHLYEEKGVNCVNDLEGMFAFAIWDSRRRQLFLARDRMGEKPLYYTIQNGQLIFASEIKAILKHPQIKREMDMTALYHYLTFFVTPAPKTLFKGINKVPPGHLMVCDENGNIQLKQYWDVISTTEEGDYPEEYYVEKLRGLLTESIRKRMMSDVPFGVFLSGGIDSSTNVALMASQIDRPVETFSVGFKDQPAYDEFEYARQIAREFKTNHHEIVIDQRDFMDYIPELIYCQDEPLADWVCVPLYFVSKLARKNGAIVIQIGEGSDEVFFGYDGYMSILNIYNRYWKPYMKMPRVFRQGIYSLAHLLSPPKMRGRKDIKNILRQAAFDEELFWGGAIAFTEAHKKLILSNPTDWQGLNSFDIIEEHLNKIDSQKPNADFLERMLYLELKHRLPELLLMRVDKVTMSTSVEGRAPYLDHNLVQFAMGVPSKFKIKNGQVKYILKQAVKGVIPENIIHRKKQGFSAPVREWFSGEMGEYVADSILTSKLRSRGIFDYRHIENMLREQRKSEHHFSTHLWNLFNLSKWYDYWIEGSM
ncbi:asparagine synthase (glutamine-hydrolyzing) [Chloroflexota bacterium]